MIRPDIIISWPRNCDYPIWRQYLRDHREQFNEVIIIFTETNFGEDYRQFIKEAMFADHVLFVENPVISGAQDWRDIAIQNGLRHSFNAPWILFTEQDFQPIDTTEEFWKTLEHYDDEFHFDAYIVVDGERIHPCFLLIKREALNRTQKNFGIVPNKLDHFGLIQKDIQNTENAITTCTIAKEMYSHMNGLSHNMTLIYRGELPNWQSIEFTQYLHRCLNVTVPLDIRFRDLVGKYFARIGE